MKFINQILIIFTFLGLNACQVIEDDSDPPSIEIENVPSAIAANNNCSAGVYKGVMGSNSGYFKISIKNGSELVMCDFVFDGKPTTLTSFSLTDWDPGQPVNGAVFTGMWDGKLITLIFSCDTNGKNLQISVSVPGHDIMYVSIFKETSETLVKCYEGTYTYSKGSESIEGNWNFIIYGNLMIGYHSDIERNGFITGTLSGTILTLGDSALGNKLTVNDMNITGYFKDKDGKTIVVTGKRSL